VEKYDAACQATNETITRRRKDLTCLSRI